MSKDYYLQGLREALDREIAAVENDASLDLETQEELIADFIRAYEKLVADYEEENK